MTEQDLIEIEARAEAATPGPLVVYYDGEVYADSADGDIPESERVAVFDDIDDARLFAYARTDIPALIAEVRRLRVENEKLQEKLDDTHCCSCSKCYG